MSFTRWCGLFLRAGRLETRGMSSAALYESSDSANYELEWETDAVTNRPPPVYTK
jgi:hypothetical protein